MISGFGLSSARWHSGVRGPHLINMEIQRKEINAYPVSLKRESNQAAGGRLSPPVEGTADLQSVSVRPRVPLYVCPVESSHPLLHSSNMSNILESKVNLTSSPREQRKPRAPRAEPTSRPRKNLDPLFKEIKKESPRDELAASRSRQQFFKDDSVFKESSQPSLDKSNMSQVKSPKVTLTSLKKKVNFKPLDSDLGFITETKSKFFCSSDSEDDVVFQPKPQNKSTPKVDKRTERLQRKQARDSAREIQVQKANNSNPLTTLPVIKDFATASIMAKRIKFDIAELKKHLPLTEFKNIKSFVLLNQTGLQPTHQFKGSDILLTPTVAYMTPVLPRIELKVLKTALKEQFPESYEISVNGVHMLVIGDKEKLQADVPPAKLKENIVERMSNIFDVYYHYLKNDNCNVEDMATMYSLLDDTYSRIVRITQVTEQEVDDPFWEVVTEKPATKEDLVKVLTAEEIELNVPEFVTTRTISEITAVVSKIDVIEDIPVKEPVPDIVEKETSIQPLKGVFKIVHRSGNWLDSTAPFIIATNKKAPYTGVSQTLIKHAKATITTDVGSVQVLKHKPSVYAMITREQSQTGEKTEDFDSALNSLLEHISKDKIEEINVTQNFGFYNAKNGKANMDKLTKALSSKSIVLNIWKREKISPQDIEKGARKIVKEVQPIKIKESAPVKHFNNPVPKNMVVKSMDFPRVYNPETNLRQIIDIRLDKEKKTALDSIRGIKNTMVKSGKTSVFLLPHNRVNFAWHHPLQGTKLIDRPHRHLASEILMFYLDQNLGFQQYCELLKIIATVHVMSHLPWLTPEESIKAYFGSLRRFVTLSKQQLTRLKQSESLIWDTVKEGDHAVPVPITGLKDHFAPEFSMDLSTVIEDPIGEYVACVSTRDQVALKDELPYSPAVYFKGLRIMGQLVPVNFNKNPVKTELVSYRISTGFTQREHVSLTKIDKLKDQIESKIKADLRPGEDGRKGAVDEFLVLRDLAFKIISSGDLHSSIEDCINWLSAKFPASPLIWFLSQIVIYKFEPALLKSLVEAGQKPLPDLRLVQDLIINQRNHSDFMALMKEYSSFNAQVRLMRLEFILWELFAENYARLYSVVLPERPFTYVQDPRYIATRFILMNKPRYAAVSAPQACSKEGPPMFDISLDRFPVNSPAKFTSHPHMDFDAEDQTCFEDILGHRNMYHFVVHEAMSDDPQPSTSAASQPPEEPKPSWWAKTKGAWGDRMDSFVQRIGSNFGKGATQGVTQEVESPGLRKKVTDFYDNLKGKALNLKNSLATEIVGTIGNDLESIISMINYAIGLGITSILSKLMKLFDFEISVDLTDIPMIQIIFGFIIWAKAGNDMTTAAMLLTIIFAGTGYINKFIDMIKSICSTAWKYGKDKWHQFRCEGCVACSVVLRRTATPKTEKACSDDQGPDYSLGLTVNLDFLKKSGETPFDLMIKDIKKSNAERAEDLKPVVQPPVHIPPVPVKMPDPEPEGWFCWLFKGLSDATPAAIAIFACGLAALLGLPKLYPSDTVISGITSMAKSLHVFGLAALAIPRIFTAVLTAIKFCIDWTSDTFSSEPSSAMALNKRVRNWINVVGAFNKNTWLNIMCTDPNMAFVYIKVFYQGLELRRSLTEIEPNLRTHFMNEWKRLGELYRPTDFVLHTLSGRNEPWHIQLFGAESTTVGKSGTKTTGGAGVGKTNVVKLLLAALKHKGHAKSVYYLNAQIPHMDNYQGQDVIVADEMHSFTDDELMRHWLMLQSESPAIVPMASLEEKGRTYDPKCFISCTNTPFPRTDKMVCDAAVYRRRNMLVRITRHDSVICPSENDFLAHMTFDLINPLKNDDILKFTTSDGAEVEAKDLNWQQFIALAIVRYEEHALNERRRARETGQLNIRDLIQGFRDKENVLNISHLLNCYDRTKQVASDFEQEIQRVLAENEAGLGESYKKIFTSAPGIGPLLTATARDGPTDTPTNPPKMGNPALDEAAAVNQEINANAESANPQKLADAVSNAFGVANSSTKFMNRAHLRTAKRAEADADVTLDIFRDDVKNDRWLGLDHPAIHRISSCYVDIATTELTIQDDVALLAENLLISRGSDRPSGSPVLEQAHIQRFVPSTSSPFSVYGQDFLAERLSLPIDPKRVFIKFSMFDNFKVKDIAYDGTGLPDVDVHRIVDTLYSLAHCIPLGTFFENIRNHNLNLKKYRLISDYEQSIVQNQTLTRRIWHKVKTWLYRTYYFARGMFTKFMDFITMSIAISACWGIVKGLSQLFAPMEQSTAAYSGGLRRPMTAVTSRSECHSTASTTHLQDYPMAIANYVYPVMVCGVTMEDPDGLDHVVQFTAAANAIGIKGRTFVVPSHLLNYPDAKSFYFRLYDPYVYYDGDLPFHDFVLTPSETTKIPDSDVTLITCPTFRQVKDIRHMWINQKDLDLFAKQRGATLPGATVSVCLVRKGDHMQPVPTVTEMQSLHYVPRHQYDDTKLETSWAGQSNVKRVSKIVVEHSGYAPYVIFHKNPSGLSGSPVYHTNTKFGNDRDGRRIILGMFAAASDCTAIVSILPVEKLNAYLDLHFEAFDVLGYNFEEAAYPPLTRESEATASCTASIIGEQRPPLMIPPKSVYHPTKIHGKIFPDNSTPAILVPNHKWRKIAEEKGLTPHPCGVGINKYNHNQPGISPPDHDSYAYEAINNAELNESLTLMAEGLFQTGAFNDVRIFDPEDVILGTHEEFIKPMDPSTSAGMPECVLGITKADQFKVEIDYLGDKTLWISPQLQYQLETMRIENELGRGSRILAGMFAKDEVVPVGKDKTRTVTMMNTATQVEAGCLMKSFFACLRSMPGNPIVLGSNLQDPDTSHRLITSLHMNNVLDLDCKNLDGSQSVQFRLSTFKLIFLVIKFSFEARGESLPRGFEQRFFSYAHRVIEPDIAFEHFIFRVALGMKSGEFGTTELNSLMVLLNLFHRFRLHMINNGFSEYATWAYFTTILRVLSLGDDILISVDPIWMWLFPASFFVQAYRLAGIQVTPPDKTSNIFEFKHVSETSFLKHTPRYSPEHDRWLFAANESIIATLTNWQSSTLPEFDQLAVNLDNALRFAYFHGREYYDRLRHQMVLQIAGVRDFSFYPKTYSQMHLTLFPVISVDPIFAKDYQF